MHFEVIGKIRDVESIASGRQLRLHRRLVKLYGDGSWRKLKGVASVRLASGTVATAEVHWYEAHGIGRKEFKIKRLL